MKTIVKKFQDIMMAATYAEAGEWDAAREMIPETQLSREPSWLNRIFMAVTFAEAGLQREAVGFLDPVPAGRRNLGASLAEELGLKGVRLMYGTVSI